MKVFKPIGSKDRFLEVFQSVNKVKLNEAFGQSLDANSVVADAFSQLKGGTITVKHSSTQVSGEETFVELICADKQGNNITFTFKIETSESDQDGVFNVIDAEMKAFSFDSADGEETVEMDENGLKQFNMQHKNEYVDLLGQYIDVDEEGVTDELYEEAIKLIDKIPYKAGSEKMVTHQQYADEKPTNSKLRVTADELKKFVKENLTEMYDEDDIIGQELDRFKKFTSNDDDVETEEPEIQDEPDVEVSEEKKQLIWQAYNNIIERSGNPSYAPTMNELMDEVDKLEGVVKEPAKKERVFPKEAEPFLQEDGEGEKKLAHQIMFPEVKPEQRELILQAYDIVVASKPVGYKPTLAEIMAQIEEMVRGYDLNEKENCVVERHEREMMQYMNEIISIAAQNVDRKLGVKKAGLSYEQYIEMVRQEAAKIFNERKLATMNEDYPTEMGKEFAPDSDYPGKKKKYKSKKVKIKEENEMEDEPTDPEIGHDEYLKKSGQMKSFDIVEDYEGEKLIKKNYMTLHSDLDFQKLAGAYENLLKIKRGEFRGTSSVQSALSSLRKVIAEYLNVVKGINVTEEDVQNYFENMLSKFSSVVRMNEEKPDDGMSFQPETDEIEQIAQEKEMAGDALEGGLADGKSPLEYNPEQIKMGIDVEKEHTNDDMVAVEIAMDHLEELPDYYTHLDKMEKEAGGEESSDSETEKILLGFKPKNVGENFDYAAAERQYADAEAMRLDKEEANRLWRKLFSEEGLTEEESDKLAEFVKMYGVRV